MEKKKSFKDFLDESNFQGLISEILEAAKSDNPDFILKVVRRAEKFRMDIEKYIRRSRMAKMLSKCITAEYLAYLTVRAENKRKPIKV